MKFGFNTVVVPYTVPSLNPNLMSEVSTLTNLSDKELHPVEVIHTLYVSDLTYILPVPDTIGVFDNILDK